MEKECIYTSFLVFNYGIKLKIQKSGKMSTVLMMLNPNNNFFLEFIEFKSKLTIRTTAFLPHVKSVRLKPEDGKLKI